MKSNLQAQIDDLYGLPLDEFTKARNALAKTLDGSDKQAVASLVKPSLAMWVINQLYWHNKPTYQALVDASEKLRAAHRAALSGRATDTRKAGELHKTTLENAFAQSIGAAEKKGVRTTEAVRDTVRRTLAALPTDEAPGRITREPPPAGFSLLTGIKPRTSEPEAKPSARQTSTSPVDIKRHRLAEKQAERARQQAEAKARQAEEKARREQERRAREIEKAERALREAERRLAELKR